jgi:hypothetical protein
MVDAVLEDFRTAPIGDRENAHFAFVEKINHKTTDVAQGDIDTIKAAGWSEEAI